MPSFYPSMVVHLRLRFDEALHIVETPDPISDVQQAERVAVITPPAQAPLLLARGDENVSFVNGRIPRKASVELNGYRQAATFDMTFDFRDLPIDPRTIRAAAVEIHLGSIPADDFARGIRSPNPNGGRDSVLNTKDPSGEPREDTLVMVGVVDKWKTSYSDSSMVAKISGRDMRGILLDSPLNPTMLEKLTTNVPIDNLVRQILAFHPFGSRFTIETNPAEWPGEHLPVVLPNDLVPRHRKGARGKSAPRAAMPGTSANLTYWDAIVRYCYLVGAIPYFIGTKLRIRPTRQIFDQLNANFDPQIPTPFIPDRPRQVGADGQPFAVRKLVYGRDIESIDFERTFAGNAKPKVIRCISMNVLPNSRGTNPVIEGRWPKDGTGPSAKGQRTTKVAPSGQKTTEEIVNIPVPGITSVERLEQIARSIFEEIGRQEIGGTCQTKNLTSFGGSNLDPDLLRLKPGDGIEFLVDVRNLGSKAPLVGSLTDHYRIPFDEKVKEIAARLGDQNLARVIVATARGNIAEVQRFFRVANVKYDWDANSGVGIGFDFQNYYVPRFKEGTDAQASGGAIASVTVPDTVGV